MGPPDQRSERSSSPSLVVVGGGLAGLAAARRLADAGCAVRLLEAGPAPGGRARHERREGYTLEPGARSLNERDHHTRALLRAAGAADEIVPLRSGGLGQIHAGWVHEIEPRGLLGRARLPGVRRWQALRSVRLERLLGRFGAGIDPEAPERAAPQDDRSLADFARLYFGRSVLDGWLAPLVASATLADEREASRALFLLWWKARGEGLPLLLRSGMGALGAALADGLDVRTHSEVQSVERAGNGFVVRTAEALIGADAVVLATPAPVTRRIAGDALISAERTHLDGVRYAPAITLHAALGDPLVPRLQDVRVPPSEGLPLAQVQVEPGRRDGRVPDGCALVRTVANAAWSEAHLDSADDVIAKSLLDRLERYWPDLRDHVRFTDVARHRLGFPRFEVGAYRALARFRRVQAGLRGEGRRLYFAGDHLAGPSVEWAVHSGLRAAGDLLSDLNG